MLVTLHKTGVVHFCLLSTNGYHVKAKNETFTAVSSCCGQNLKYRNVHVVAWDTTSKNCTKKRAARAARLFFPHSANQIIDLWRCCRCRRCFLNFLLVRYCFHPNKLSFLKYSKLLLQLYLIYSARIQT